MEYTLSEFRKKTREAFNKAEALEEVIIERYGLRYRLTRAEDLPNNTVSSGSVLSPRIVATIDSVTHDKIHIKVPATRFEQGVCKIHGLPLDSRGRCLQKECKYA